MQGNDQLLYIDFLRPYRHPHHSVTVFEISFCLPSQLCGLTLHKEGLVETELGRGLLLFLGSALPVDGDAIPEPLWAALHSPNPADTQKGERRGVTGGPGGTLLPQGSLCHSLSPDSLRKYY